MMRSTFFVFLAIVAHAQEADVCHEHSEDPSCLLGGDSAAVSLLQKDVAVRVRVPRGLPNVAPHIRVLTREDNGEDKGPCVDSTTYTDPYWGDNCAAWAHWGCDVPGLEKELKKNCPVACKACGKKKGGKKPAAPAPATPKEWVDAHNVYRCMHGVPLLKWNEVMATKAQAWADETGGEMKHSSSEFRSDVAGFSYLGENLAWASPNPPSAAQSVKMWYDEIKDTDGGSGLVKDFNYKTGHYTQVVWKDSTDLGCGGYKGLTVCMYGPGGNFGFSEDYVANVKAPVKSEAECKQ